jgi:penicillin-binding protein 1B
MLRRALLLLALLTLTVVVVGAVVAVPVVRRLDREVVEKFNGRRWNFPSRIYSDAFLIYPGLNLRAAGLADRLVRLNYREADAEPLRKGDFRRTPNGLDLFLRDFSYPGQRIDDRLVHLDLDGDVVVAMRDLRSGEALYSLQLEPELISGLYGSTWEERREVPLAEVPPMLVRTLIVTEDRRFYSHHGFDPIGILRALVTNLRSGEVVQGGSTLTQQLVKNFFLTEERRFDRKIKEAIMAVLIERRFGKAEILENYLNEIYFGQNGLQGIYGVWEASEFYFARPPHELSVGDMALLVGLIRAPNALSPFRNPERARERRDTVLRLLLADGAITPADYDTAKNEPLHIAAVHARGNAAPNFVDFLREDLGRNYPREVLTSDGLGIFTSLDIQLQQLAASAVRNGIAELERRHPRLANRDPEHRVQAALIAVRPQTGAIVAMVGGRDYETTQFNRAVHAHRQPGSIFKPLVFLTAFEAARDADDPITPALVVSDEPFEWTYDGGTWRPSNYRNEYMGDVTARRALELSLNAATARIANRVGLEPILEMAQRVGIQSPLPPYPSVILGAVEVTPLEIAQAYAVIANQGLKATVRGASKLVDRQGQMVERRPLAVERVVSPEAAYLVTHLMEGVLDRGTGRGVRERGFTRPAAAKTGTTNDARDAWFGGFTPDLLAVVWVGFDDNEALGLTGAEAALPIWTEFMQGATAAAPPTGFHPPTGVALVRIDPYTGGIATAGCPETLLEAFWRGQEPTAACPVHSPQPSAPAAAAAALDAP